MPGPLERWLETFLCGQFADNFERYGYRTLQTVCQMQLPQLLSIGIPHKESEIILQNIQILRQSTAAVAQQQMQHGMSGSYSNSMSHDHHGTSFQGRDVLQEHTNYMGPDRSCYNYGSQSSSVSGQFYNQGVSQSLDPMMSSAYRQQYQGSSSYPQQLADGAQYSNMGMPSPSSSAAVVTSRHAFPGHVPGSPLMGQSNMQHSHPHLRSSGQTPQEVANNILHMAASSYPTNNTVQVPLSKSRSSPYHVPSRSPNYNSKLQDNQQLMCSDYNQGQFAYPSPPHQSQLHMQSRDPRLSPISPASVGMIPSPHSHQSGRSVPSSSPCSMHSPSKGLVRSPGPNSQFVNSPQRGQYQMSSSMNTSHQRMVSPIPSNQQLKVSVPSSMSQPFQQCYFGNMLNTSQYPTFQQPMSVQYSPSSISQISNSGQFCNSPGSHSGNFPHSPGGHSGHFSNISSPYTPGSGNYLSPGQTHSSPSTTQHVPDSSVSHSPNMKQCNSPLQSLQKLCMLPEAQVVDPKTVVKEACVPSPNDSSIAKSIESSLSIPVCTNAPTDSSFSPAFNEVVQSSSESEVTQSISETAVSPDVKCQPKKMMLLRAAKDDLCSPQSDETVQYCSVKSESDDTKDYKIESVDDGDDKKHLIDQSSVESLNTDRNNSDIFDGKTNTSETDKKKTCEPSECKTPAENCEGGSAKDGVDSNVENKAFDYLKPGSENGIQGIENVPDSSRNKETCDANFGIGATTSENVQLNTANIEQGAKVQSKDVEVAYESESSDSDNESQLLVRKDVKKTYSKQERLKSFEISPRLRGDSTGSLSDDRDNSDFEYEDHIGCDDIETGFSDIDDKSNEIIEESVDDAKDLDNDITDGGMVIDRVMITGSCWEKNGIRKRSISNSQKHKKNGHVKRLPFMREVSEIDSDDVPSPLGGDVVDGLEGPVGVDNGDGTVSVRRPSHIRQRKTPVKYKDTSFFQGDFIFVEEEEQFVDEPKRKMAKKSIDVNHNPKKNGVVKKSDNTCSSNNNASSSLKAKHCVKPKIQVSSDSSVSKNLEDTMKLLAKQKGKMKAEKSKSTFTTNNIKFVTKGSDGKLKEVKTVTVVKEVTKDDCVRNSVSKTGILSVNQAPKSKSDPKNTPSHTTAVMTRKSSKQECNIEKNESVKKKAPRRQLNGVKTDSINGQRKGSERTHKSSSVVNQNTEKMAKTKKLKQLSKEKAIPDDDIEVIEIDSEDSVGAANETGANNNVTELLEDREAVPKAEIVAVECQNLVSDEEKEGRGYMFSLVEDEVVDEKLVGEIHTDLKEKTEEGDIDIEHETPAKENIKRSSSGSNIKCKRSSARRDRSKTSGKGVKRKAFIDHDPDFEFGSIKKAFKSNKLDQTRDSSSSKKTKKKVDRWANFKGPKVVFDGIKETAKNCVVINDPYEESVSKKTKTTAQNVTRIEISQLPSDKSVLIPYNETTENEEWICALCGKHSSYKFLGDLFGPYTVEIMSDDMLDLSPKVRLGTKKKRSEESQSSVNKSNKSGRRASSVSQEASEWKEVWVHESCSVYSDGVFLIGSKIYGLQEAVRIASQTPCSVCNEMGAMIGCLNKGCQQKFHHVCAQGADCYLDEENFSLLCPKHKVKKIETARGSIHVI
ncbi:uncharacterized protein LOC123564608 isoform X2 [Mercenaria mercenaria]|uniref:uncharacterized protein LOC123564608 isoform X2 n=1 Tax=Mercenaria mercenaria TaxID=6596 RepID=UPI00234E7026|nr:uncharacterized protein LOC123564608 isoform X2 [Mercenaria mercenaria]